MRVVAGEARGRRLVAPAGRGTRPTLDRVRQALFNSLGSLDAVEGSAVLDLFAGSGALGIEALSRGASTCTFVDDDRAARSAIAENLRATGLTDRASIVADTAIRWLLGAGARSRFDLALLDPPYSTTDEEWSALLDGLSSIVRRADGGPGIVVVESDRSLPLPGGWDALREKGYGSTIVAILQPPDPPVASPAEIS